MENTDHDKKKISITAAIIVGAVIFVAAVTVMMIVLFSGPTETAVINPISDITTVYPAETISTSDAAEINAPVPSISPENVKEYSEPLVFEKGGKIYMASGLNAQCLGDKDSIYKDGLMTSENNHYLFYLKDYEEKSDDSGTLIRIACDRSSSPLTMASGVYGAEASYDGEKVLYITGYDYETGMLYLWENGKSELIAENAACVDFLFSPDGNSICYIVEDSDDYLSIYVKKGDDKPAFVNRFEGYAEEGDDGKMDIEELSIDGFENGGKLIYTVSSDYSDETHDYIFTADGKNQESDNSLELLKSFGPAGSVYKDNDSSKNVLVYKYPDGKQETISSDYDSAAFPAMENGTAYLLISENDTYGFGKTLYEIYPGKSKTKLAKTDGGFVSNINGNCLVYERGVSMYALNRTESGWKEEYIINASEARFGPGEDTGMKAEFDPSGKYLYLFGQHSGKKYYPLYCYSSDSGKTEKLIDTTAELYSFGDSMYALSSDGKAYRLNGNTAELIGKDTKRVVETAGGVYLITRDKKIVYVPKGASEGSVIGSYSDIGFYITDTIFLSY